MSDDWRPSHFKPRGGWRALLPDWRVLLAVLAGAAALAVKVIVFDGWGPDTSFNLMKIGVTIVAAACVAPHLLTRKPPPRPGHFPVDNTDHHDETR